MFTVLLLSASTVWAVPVADITDFGANGDDQLDDGPDIQEAIDSLAVSGGIVYFPPGVFKVLNTIYVPSNIKLQGTGSTQYNTHVQLLQINRPLFEVTGKGATNIVFKDLFLVAFVNGIFPRTDETQTDLIRGENTVAISLKARNPGLSNIVIENVRAQQFTYGIKAVANTGIFSQVNNVKIRNFVSDGNEYALHTNTYGANNWDVQNMNVFTMYYKQNGLWLERSGQMRFLQLSCAGASTARTCAKVWETGEIYFRQMHVEGPPLGICVGTHCDPTQPVTPVENSAKLIVENSATNAEVHRFTNFVFINNRMWLPTPSSPPPPPNTTPPPPGQLTFVVGTTGVNSSLRACDNVWVQWHPAFHTSQTRVNILPSDNFFPGLATTPVTVCSNSDLTSVPVFDTGYDPDDQPFDDDRNIEAYGAWANDDNDDFNAFKSAINDALASRARRIHVPCGRFDVGDESILDRGITIVGATGCPAGYPSEIRLHGTGVAMFTILNTPVENATLMQGIAFRNLLLTSESDKGTIGINFENYSATEVGGAADFQIQNVDFEGFDIGVATRPFDGIGSASPMYDSVSIKDGDFNGNTTAISMNSDNASNWNMEDIRVEGWNGGEGVRINRGNPSLRNLSCNGFDIATACLTIQRQSGASVDNMTAVDVLSALNVPLDNGSTQFPVTIRNSNLIEGVYFEGRIFLNSVNNQYPAAIGWLPPNIVRKVVTFSPNNTSIYGGRSDVFTCGDVFSDPHTSQDSLIWLYVYTGPSPGPAITYCN